MNINESQQAQLEALLRVPEGAHQSPLDALRTGPVLISGPSLVRSLSRLQSVRHLGIAIPATVLVPTSRIATLARFADKAKVSAVLRLPEARRLATLVASMHTLEASAQDDAIELLEMLLNEVFGEAEKEDKKTRLRTLKDLDALAITLADACKLVVDPALPDERVRIAVYAQIPRDALIRAIHDIGELVRPPDDLFYKALQSQYRRVRRFLPALLEHIRFSSGPAEADLLAGLDYLRHNAAPTRDTQHAPMGVVPPKWRCHVGQGHGVMEQRAYTFCVLDQLRTALRRREVFVSPSWRYADPRRALLSGTEWQSTGPMICRNLGLTPNPKPVIAALTAELDDTYSAVVARLPHNPAVRFERIDDKNELMLTGLDKLDEPVSLLALRAAVAARLPRVELPEIILEIAARAQCAGTFTHVSERTARAADLDLSLCAVLLAEACNTGLVPLVRSDIPALCADRLSWVNQNYVRDETLVAANARLVAAQNDIPLAHAWGGGAVPGALRDSLLLLALILDQQTELQPTQIMTDTGAYADVVFGLFRLLGFRFCPRLADMGGTRFWRIDPHADYGLLNDISRHRVHLARINESWDDMLRLAGSLKLGRGPATGIMRTLQVGERATRLAQGIAELSRIDKTLHTLSFIDDDSKRRRTLVQLNRGEGRHGLSRVVFHGQRGELRQHYREGQEDQLGALGLVVNMIVLWNTLYMQAAIDQLRAGGFPVLDADIAHLSPHGHAHINMLGRYSFAVPELVARGDLRPLRNPANDGP
jgi:TnpA family transposase